MALIRRGDFGPRGEPKRAAEGGDAPSYGYSTEPVAAAVGPAGPPYPRRGLRASRWEPARVEPVGSAAAARIGIQAPSYRVIYRYRPEQGRLPLYVTMIPESPAFITSRVARHSTLDTAFYYGPQRRRDANTSGPNAGLTIAAGTPQGRIAQTGTMRPRGKYTKALPYPRAGVLQRPREYGRYEP